VAVMKKAFCILAALSLCLCMGTAFGAEEVISYEEFMGIEGAAEAVQNGDEAALEEALEQENVISFEEFISMDGVLEAILSGDEAALEAILEQAAQPAQQPQPAQQYTQPGVVPQVEAGPEQRVFDLAGLFSEAEREALEERIAKLRKDIAPYDAALLTADNGVYDTQDYADRFYEDHGIGTDQNRSGVLFFLDMQNRTMWISTAGDLIGIITDEREQEIFYAQDYYLGEGDWAGAMMAALEKTEEFVRSGVQQGAYIYDEATGQLIENQQQYTDLHDSEYYRRQAMGGVARSTGMGGIFGAIVGFITRGSIKSKYGKKYEPAKYDWQSKSSLSLTTNSSAVTNKFVTTRVIPRNNNSGGSSMGGGFGGSGGGIHMSSGGMSHGGGGHKF